MMHISNMPYFASDEPVAGGDASQTAPTVPTTPAAPAANEPSGPWSESLQRAFPDEAVRGQVDQYLRSEVQPYITRKEQELGEVGKVWSQLWDEDMTFPTFLELGAQLYGPEVATTIAQSLATHFEQQGMSPEDAAAAAVEVTETAAGQELGTQQTPKGPPSFDEWLQNVPPEFRQYVTEEFATREDKAYETQLDAIAKDVEPTINANRELFSRYVAATEGDLSAAVALWQRELAPMIREHPDVFGYEDPAASAAAAAEAARAPRREAPTVLGNQDAPGSTTPPQIPAHQSFDDAVDDFLADMRKNKGGAAGRV